MTASRHRYIARINRVVDHIDAHLGEPLDLIALAAVANFSPWHFHRVFQAMTGETLAERVRRRRLEVAAARLLGSPPESALVVAVGVGFGSAEVFTRAFKAHFGVTPSAWRRGAWREWAARHQQQLSKIHQAERKAHQAVVAALCHDGVPRPVVAATDLKGTTMNVELKTLPDMRLAYMRHTGPYGSPGISQTWQRFGAWAAQHGAMKPGGAMVGISQDSPDLTAPEKCRYDACVEVDAEFRPEGEVGVQTLPGRRYACGHFNGTALEIHAAWQRMFGEWLPDSGWQTDEGPAIELYDLSGMDAATERMTCLLCVPVRAL